MKTLISIVAGMLAFLVLGVILCLVVSVAFSIERTDVAHSVPYGIIMTILGIPASIQIGSEVWDVISKVHE